MFGSPNASVLQRTHSNSLNMKGWLTPIEKQQNCSGEVEGLELQNPSFPYNVDMK